MILVDKWLEGIGLGYVVPAFTSQGINSPEMLSELDVVDFPELGISDHNDRKKLFYLIQRVRLAIDRGKPADTTAEPQADAAIASTPSDQGRRHQVSASNHASAAPKEPVQRNTTTADSGVRFRREVELGEERDVEGYARASRRKSGGGGGGGGAGFGFKQTPSKLQRFPSSHRRSKTPHEDAARSSTPRASARQAAGEDKMFSSGRAQERRRGSGRAAADATEKAEIEGSVLSTASSQHHLPPRKDLSGEEYFAFERRIAREQSMRSESATTSGDGRRSRASSPLPQSPRRSVQLHSRRDSGGDPRSGGVSRSWDLSDGAGENLRDDRKEVEVYSVRSRRSSAGSSQSRDPTAVDDLSATAESKRLTRARARSRLRAPSGHVAAATPNNRSWSSTPTDADAGAGAVSYSRHAREVVSSHRGNRDSGGSGRDRVVYRDRDSTDEVGASQRAQESFADEYYDEDDGGSGGDEEQTEEDKWRKAGEQTERAATRALANHLIAIHREDVRSALAVARRDVELVSKAEKDRDPAALLEYAREVEGMLGERLAAGARLRAALDSYMSMRRSVQSRPQRVGR